MLHYHKYVTQSSEGPTFIQYIHRLQGSLKQEKQSWASKEHIYWAYKTIKVIKIASFIIATKRRDVGFASYEITKAPLFLRDFLSKMDGSSCSLFLFLRIRRRQLQYQCDISMMRNIINTCNSLKMELNKDDIFREIMVKNYPQLNENQLILKKLESSFMKKQDVQAFDDDIQKQLKVDHTTRLNLYEELFISQILNNLNQQLFLAWFYYYIKTGILGPLNEPKTQGLTFHLKELVESIREAEEFDQLIYAVLQYMFTNIDHPLHEQEIQKYTLTIRKQNIYQFYQQRQEKFQLKRKGVNKHQRVRTQRLINQGSQKLMKCSSRFIPGSFEYVIAEAMIQIREADKKKELKVGELIEKIKNTFAKEKGDLEFLNRHRINEIISDMPKRCQRLNQLYQSLEQILKLVLILDIAYLEDLIDKAKAAKSKIAKKNVILVIGKTGSGKSTLILKLLGNNFKLIQRDNGSKYWAPDENLNPDHESFKTSNEAVSETSVINVAQIPEEMKENLNSQDREQELYICDTPGFEDTKREQNDIANQKGVINAIKSCNSIRIVVVIPISSFLIENGRMDGVRSIATTISNLCPTYSKAKVNKSTKIYINQTITYDHKNVTQNLESLLKNSKDNQMNNIQKDFILQVKNQSKKSAAYICPVSQSIQDYKQKIDTLVNLNPICCQKIDQIFASTQSEKSKIAIQNFFASYHKNFMKMFEAQKFQRAKYYYDSLVKLEKLLFDEQFTDGKHIKESIAFIRQQIARTIDDFQHYLSNIVHTDVIGANYQRIKQKQDKLDNIFTFFKQQVSETEYLKQINTLIGDAGQIIKAQFQQKEGINKMMFADQMVQKILKFSSFFDAPQIISSLLSDKRLRYSQLLKIIEKQCQQQSYGIQSEILEQIIFLSTVLNKLWSQQQKSQGFPELKKFRKIQQKASGKIKDYVRTINLNLQQIFTDTIADQINDKLEKIHKYLQSKLSNNLAQQTKLYDDIKMKILETSLDKISKLSSIQSGTDNESIMNRDISNNIKLIKGQIQSMMKIHIVNKQYLFFYENTIKEITQKFEYIQQDVEETVQLLGKKDSELNSDEVVRIQNLSTDVKNLYKFSQIIPNKNTEIILENLFNVLIEYFRNCLSSEENFQVNLGRNPERFKKAIQKITYFSKKIKSQKNLLNHEKLKPLKKIWDERVELFDKKISKPICTFNRELKQLKQEIQKSSNKNPENIQESKLRSNDSEQILFFFKQKLDMFDLLLSYIHQIRQLKQLTENLQKFNSQCQILNNLTRKVFTERSVEMVRIFTKSTIDSPVEESFIQLAHLLTLIETRQYLHDYLKQLNFNSIQQLMLIHNKMKILQQQYRQVIKNQGEQCKYIYSYYKNIMRLKDVEDKIKSEGKIKPTKYDQLSSIVNSIMKKSIKDTEEKIKLIITNDNSMIKIFQEITPVISEIQDNENKQTQRLLSDLIFFQLKHVVESIKKKIQAFEQERNQMYDCDKQEKNQSNQIIHYISNCESLVIFREKTQNIPQISSKKKTLCLNTITMDYIENKFKELAKIFNEQVPKALQSCKKINLVEFKSKNRIVQKINKVFKNSKRQDLSIQVNKYKISIINSIEQLSGIRSNSTTQLIKQIEKRQIKDVFTRCYSEITQFIHKKYKNLETFSLDKNFKTYYYYCTYKEKQDLNQTIQIYINDRINQYEKNEGTYSDQQFKKIEIQISYLPYEIAKQWQYKLREKVENFKKDFCDKENDYLKKCQSDYTVISQIVQKLNLISRQKEIFSLYSNLLQKCLDMINKKQKKTSNQLQIMKQCYQNINQVWQIKKDSKIQQIFKQNYKILITSLETKSNSIFSKLQQIIGTKEAKQFNFTENEKNISQLFGIYRVIVQNKKSLFCSIEGLQASVQSKWEQSLYKIIKQAFKLIENNKCLDILSMQKNNMGNHFKHSIFNEKIIDTIRSQVKTIQADTLFIQNKKKSETFKVIQKQLQQGLNDNITGKIYKEVEQKLTRVSSYKFLKPGRHNTTIKQLVQQLNQLALQLMILEDKKEIFNENIFQKGEYNNMKQRILTAKNNLKTSFDSLVDFATKEVSACFQNVETQPCKYINIYFNITQSIRQVTQYEIVPSNYLKQQKHKMEKLIYNNFAKLQQSIIAESKDLYDQSNKIQTKVQQLNKILEKQLRQCQSIYQKQSQEVKLQFETKLEQQIKACTNNDEQTKSRNKNKGDLNTKLNQLRDTYSIQVATLRQKNETQIDQMYKKGQKEMKKLALDLILFQKNILQIKNVDDEFKHFFKEKMNEYADEDERFQQALINAINNCNDPYFYGKYILKSYKAFESYEEIQRQKRTKPQHIGYVLDNLIVQNSDFGPKSLTNVEKTEVKSMFEQVKNQFDTQVYTFQSNSNEKTKLNLKYSILNYARQLKGQYMESVPTTKRKQKFLGMIIALYGILRNSSTSSKKKSISKVTFMPHEIQVVTMLLLLGIQKNNPQPLQNRMAQVGTGEGKSIVLAILSAYFALVGFNVRCSCYSEYLSERDAQQFDLFFSFLEINQQIKYGTFNQVCEEILNTNGTDFKKQVSKMVHSEPKGFLNKLADLFIGTSFVNNNKMKKHPTILLIDEADVFFNKEFYGQCYRPSITLRSESISKLLQYVWVQTRNNPQRVGDRVLENIENSQQFKIVVKEYPNIADILNNQLNDIITGAYNYEHKYVFSDQKLVYIQNDSINKRLSYGYKTVFANLAQYQKGKVSKSNLNEALCIELAIAEFSYAALPKFFRHIIGVTGTLQSMPLYKKKILKQQYDVKANYVIPSSFGLHLKKKKSYIKVQQKDHFKTIIQMIKKIDQQRPILIFFKNDTILYEFYNCPEYLAQFSSRTKILTEQNKPYQRAGIVKSSTNLSQITLMTKAFGRGTDFKVYQITIDKKGGVHVIQTWLSQEQSQEDQIAGRTNRQNTEGSFEVIYTANELIPFIKTAQQNPKDLERLNKVLKEDREKIAESQKQGQNIQKIASLEHHNKVLNVYSSKSLKQKQLIDYIMSINNCKPFTVQKVRTVIALDGTISMRDRLQKVKMILQETSKRTYEIIEKEDVNISVEMMVMIYRNYNSTFNQLLEKTPFENCCGNILKFLNTVEASGGMGNEAIEICFYQLNKIEQVSQVILIGDAGWNTVQEVKSKRERRGQNYWLKHNVPETNAHQELLKFEKKKCPIHTYYIYSAKNNFFEISQRTGGVTQEWPERAIDPAKQLSHFISKEILKIADKKCNTKLVEAYNKMYR